MKWLKRLRLINWHYFQDEILEFGKQTLISGQNGAGKSTIIDALQVLIISDQRQIKFNSSAHDEAKRTMISYLRGKIGSEEKGFLREGGFNSYIIAEFRDDQKRDSFVVGVVIDVFREQSYEEEFFIMDSMKLTDIEVLKPSGHLRNREDFRRFYAGGKGRTIFERNKTNYQKQLRSRLGHLDERFFSVFSRALSFKPIQNVREFVYQYILEKRELQLDLMRENFYIHERYKKELDELQERKEKLQAISNQFRQYQQWQETTTTQYYVILRLKHLFEQEELAEILEKINTMTKQLTHAEINLVLAEKKQQEAVDNRQQAFSKWQNHNFKKQEDDLKDKIKELTAAITHNKIVLKQIHQQVAREYALLESLIAWQGNTYWQWQDGELEELQILLELQAVILTYTDPSKQDLCAYQLENLTEKLKLAGGFLADFYDRFNKADALMEKEINEIKKQVAQLEQEIQNLEKKKRTYPPSVEKLKDLLEEKLAGKAQVRIFCEEMEISHDSWRNSIEGYLNTQRFDLLVDPTWFSQALSIYEQDKWNLGIEGVGLVDTEKEKKYLGTAKPGSLADILDTEDLVIKARIEHLLGKVMMAQNEQELRLYSTAITKSCMTYHNLVAKQIPKRNYEIPYIGSEAIPRQLEIKRLQLEELQQTLNKWEEEQAQNNTWINRLKGKGEVYLTLASQLKVPLELRQQEEELEEKNNILQRLDLSEVKKLEQEYNYWKNQEQYWSAEAKKESGERERLKEKITHQKTNIQFHDIKITEAESLWLNWLLENEPKPELKVKAEKRWSEAQLQTIATSKKIANWEGNYSGNLKKFNDEFQKLRDKRHEYNIHYIYSGKIESEDNKDYEKLLNEIEEVDIPKYQEKLAQALKDSEQEFKSHFIYKMKEAIELAKREFYQLNFALKNFPFHEEKYHFDVKPSEFYKKFYEVIMDPNVVEEGSLFDLAEGDKATNLHELFEILIKGEAGEQDEFTDYRRYLDFDIIVSNRGTKYSFSKVLKEKSGGETQTPFYIAILASFHHLYSSQKTTRLVVFDEAFNKMDEQRIQTSLRLIKQMNLQLIAAVPDEKMQHMVPEVTTTLLVNNVNFQCFVDLLEVKEAGTVGGINDGETTGRKSGEEEIPIQNNLFTIN